MEQRAEYSLDIWTSNHRIQAQESSHKTAFFSIFPIPGSFVSTPLRRLDITVVTVFPENIYSQNEDYSNQAVNGIEKLNTDIELKHALMTGDLKPNPTIACQPSKLAKCEIINLKGIDIYAFVIGGAIDIVISAIVFAIWLAVDGSTIITNNWVSLQRLRFFDFGTPYMILV
ncbi:hypothetical protein VPNG_08689 [Cytospora leucostoma]|uniref:Uncharacterized protein n=1 Tax=Cytospora leucostoma TaxID=1230097 RepID=A0A423W2C9_9PEZI|nr:hypothetical protein VPNG_08689 [Cytospora leucostoma]